MTSINKFISGFKRFQHENICTEQSILDSLRQGQAPKVLMIACCDSRADPALLTDSAPGDLFIIRNIANLVPPYAPDLQHHGVSAGLEYATNHLKVEHIVILGHRQCGGIKALLDGTSPDDEFIGPWMSIAEPARKLVEREFSADDPEQKLRALEQASLLISLENLLSFPWVKKRVDEGTLSLHGWYFDLETGELFEYDQEGGAFTNLVEACELTSNNTR